MRESANCYPDLELAAEKTNGKGMKSIILRAMIEALKLDGKIAVAVEEAKQQ